MPRVSGVIGYGETRNTQPGVWEDVIVEHKFRGDVLRNSRGLETADKVNDDISVSNSISVVASAYHREHFFDARYISWQGKLWKIADVEVLEHRLKMRLGGLYNGPTAETSPATG